jgi:hypothetical protein
VLVKHPLWRLSLDYPLWPLFPRLSPFPELDKIGVVDVARKLRSRRSAMQEWRAGKTSTNITPFTSGVIDACSIFSRSAVEQRGAARLNN